MEAHAVRGDVMPRCPVCLNPQTLPKSKSSERERMERNLAALRREEEALQKKLHDNLVRQHRLEVALRDA